MKKTYPKVVITDETLRDGLQIEREGITIEEKLELIEMLAQSGLKRLVVGAFVNAKWSPQMGDTAELVKRLVPHPGVQYFAIALNERGRQMAREASPPLSTERFLATHLHMCDVFLLRNTNRTPEEQEQGWQLPIQQALKAGVKEAGIGLSAPWGSNWSGSFTHQRRMDMLTRQWDAWKAAGITVTRVDLADPMSWNHPDVIEEDLLAIKQRFPTIREFHLHMHNGRGLAPLSAWEALRVLDAADTLMLESAVGGIGGCPYCANGQATGMIPTEDLVQLLEVIGIPTGVNLPKLIEAAHRLSALLQHPLDGRVHQVGPLPSGDSLYDPELPVVYTWKEAQHFRLGPSVCESTARPWQKKAAAAAEAGSQSRPS